MKREDIQNILNSIVDKRKEYVITIDMGVETVSYPLRYKTTLYEDKPQWCIWIKEFKEWLSLKDWSVDLIENFQVSSL